MSDYQLAIETTGGISEYSRTYSMDISLNDVTTSLKDVAYGLVEVANTVVAAVGDFNIPGIPYLYYGTEGQFGGFTFTNEDSQGELTCLLNGSQVISHNLSLKYTKELAEAYSVASMPLDFTGVMEGMVIQVINNTTVDGTPLREIVSDYTIHKIGNRQKAQIRAKGAY